MPVHDWSRVTDASFHDFHQTWLGRIKGRRNRGLLPRGYFAHMERHLGWSVRVGRVVELFANPLAVGDDRPDVPMSFTPDLSIELPLAAADADAFEESAPHDRQLLTRPA